MVAPTSMLKLADFEVTVVDRERVEGRRFETLLQACDGLDSEQDRGRCREQVIMAASGRWLGMSDWDKSRLVTIGAEGAEQGEK